MIKKSLRMKLIISYLAVALLTVLVVSIFIRLTSGQQLLSLVAEQQASLLKEEAAFYYSETGSWDGFSETYLASEFTEGKPEPDSNQQLPPHKDGFPREIRGKHGLVDTSYKAIIPFMNYQVGQIVPEQFLTDLIAVEVDGETVAWIIPDKGFQFKLSSEEMVFLKRSNQAILLAAVAGVAGAVLMGIALAGIFLKPIRSLIQASKQLAAGDLEQQVPVHSQDELGQLSETFNQMSADLATADRQRRQLTADITHDLSTPLQVIAGYIEMLEDDEVALTPQRIQIIMNEIELLRRLVGDLSLLTTADSKELQMQIEPTEPQALLEQVQQAFEAIARKKDITIRRSIAPNTPMISVDQGRMVQVIGNLVDNALRYTPAGGTIELSAGMVQNQVEMRVKDSGSGIHPEDIPYIFDRFYKADKSRNGNSGKMGLGLAIAKALVSAQGGSIWIEPSTEARGTTFVIRFDPL